MGVIRKIMGVIIIIKIDNCFFACNKDIFLSIIFAFKSFLQENNYVYTYIRDIF